MTELFLLIKSKKFNLNQEGEPEGVYFKVSKDANHMIEEFMLAKKWLNLLASKRKHLFIEFTMNLMLIS
jgi:exoribonuclease R